MISLILALALAPSSAHADENIQPVWKLLAQGYRQVAHIRTTATDVLPPAHATPWPVAFQDSAHTIGNSMAEFQPFGAPYFHGGCDLRTKAGEEIHATVSGRLEAGHYGYDTNADGSMTKYWMPWPQQGDATYFEVAVITDDGTRYENHHVDRDTLPDNIVAMLNAGAGRVTAGTLLGHVLYWPDGDYHHTHFNIVLPSGVRVNPEYASKLLPDTKAPEILGLFALTNGGSADFGNGTFAKAPTEFVVDVVDHQDLNIYDHPPVYARLHFSSGQETVWDFRTTLTGKNGAFPPLWDFFLESLRGPDGSHETEGGYGTGHSLIRLAVPAGAKGPFTIELGDIAGNITTRAGTISP
ncbi:MAG: hypothetical protein ACXWR1_04110 [Bdellovibrionota bacterium]